MARRGFEQRVAELLEDAGEAAAQRDVKAARALAESVLALDPHNKTARRLLDESRLADEGGEWRQLTVMFSDLVGSTQLAADHDPEVVREVLRAYQDTANAAVGRYDGHVAQYLGDGVLAYFGYPTPHEDDPRRAVQAGIDLLARLREVAGTHKERHGLDLAARIAVHTGMVIRGDTGPLSSPNRDAVVGETPNIAARLQEVARPGALVISDATLRLVHRYFQVEPLGSFDLRGVSRAMDVYEVVGELPAARPIEVQTELSSFVDRDDERQRLGRLWGEVVDGGSEVVLLRGEPGIGKSRLLETLRTRVTAEGGCVFPFHCSTFQATTHLYPARRMVSELCAIDLATGLIDAPRRLREALAASDLDHHLPLFGALLGLPPQPECPAPELDGHMLREATIASLIEWIERESARSVGAAIVDDVQWADPSTMELLSRIIGGRAPRLLVVLSSRNDFETPWRGIEVLELGPLAAADLERMAAASPAAKSLAAAQVAEMVGRSDGVPLYFEELLRLGDQPSRGPAPRLTRSQTAIPQALLDPLLARLAAPGVELGLIQTLACIGQEVRHDLLASVVDVADDELQPRLARLVAAGLLTSDETETPTYRFRHHLLRELAYETQLSAARVRRHARIADALRDRIGSQEQTDAGLLAQHLERAGSPAEAVQAYVDAAQNAHVAGAFTEAMEVLDKALKLLADIPDDRARYTLELTVRRVRGFSRVATLGWAAPGSADEHQRCLELSRLLDPGPEHLPDLIAVWSYYLLHGEVGLAEYAIAVDRRRIGSAPDEPPNELFSGHNRYYRGDVTGASSDLVTYLRTEYARRSDTSPQWPLPNDPTVAALTLLGVLNQLQGDQPGAVRAIGEAKSRAAELPFPRGPFSMAYARSYACLVDILVRDYEAADAEVGELLALAERHGFTFFILYGQLQRAIATLWPGAAADLDAVSQSLAVWRQVGAELWVPAFLTEIADYRLERGDGDAALDFLHEAAEISTHCGIHNWAAETARVRGKCRLAGGDAGGIEDLRRAADLAERQGARLFELRARTALCDAVGAGEEFGRLVALVNTFAGGPGAPELDEARRLVSAKPLSR